MGEPEDVAYLVAGATYDKETVARVEDLDRRAVAIQADVRSREQLDQAVECGVSEFGKIDILCANAGVYSRSPFWEMSEEMWQDMIDINLTGVWRSAKAVTPHMIERRQGAIVMTSSINGFEAGLNFAHYVAAKHGVLGLMRNVAVEMAPYNVRCNAVCPGAIDTAMINNPTMYQRFASDQEPTREVAYESVRHFHLLNDRSMLPPEAVSDAILWLVSDEAAQVTGVALPVDAGHMILPGFNPEPTR